MRDTEVLLLQPQELEALTREVEALKREVRELRQHLDTIETKEEKNGL